MAVDLRLNQDFEDCHAEAKGIPWIDREERRHVWWVLQVMDRQAYFVISRRTSTAILDGPSFPTQYHLWQATPIHVQPDFVEPPRHSFAKIWERYKPLITGEQTDAEVLQKTERPQYLDDIGDIAYLMISINLAIEIIHTKESEEKWQKNQSRPQSAEKDIRYHKPDASLRQASFLEEVEHHRSATTLFNSDYHNFTQNRIENKDRAYFFHTRYGCNLYLIYDIC